ncbi:MAG: response regulator transcription factor [Devosia sp.]|uniref:response regulator transcription factor n=1 Tax=Devosia sp. TaxID=1871048 RepID=UPI003393473C
MSRKLLIVDDHLLFADAVKFLLESSGADIDAQVFSSLASVLDFLSTDAPVDLLLLDYSMPGPSGIEAVEMAAARRPGLRIAFLSGLDDPQVAGEALQRGVVGWLPKSMPGESLINALNLVLAGERFVPADLMLRQQASPLTPREQDVAALVARGLSDKEIAEQLELQVGTVKVHVKSLLRKFEAANRTQFALRYRGS